MKSLFFVWALAIAAVLTSCVKSAPSVAPAAAPAEKGAKPRPVVTNGGGEDDDLPVIIVKTKGPNSVPVSNSMVVMSNGSDTLSGLTDANGQRSLTLPRYGSWGLQIVHDSYQTVNSTVDVSAPVTTRTDSLQGN